MSGKKMNLIINQAINCCLKQLRRYVVLSG